MYCSNCGTELPAGAKFCQSCGTNVGAEPATPQTTPASPAASTRDAPVIVPVKMMATWKIVLLAVGAVIGTLAAFGLIAIAFSMFLTSDLVAPVDRQLAALKAGDLDAAYAETSVAFREATPFDAFKEFVKNNPVLTEASDHTVGGRHWENNDGTVSVTLETAGGVSTPLEYTLVWEDEKWKIQHMKLGGG